MSPSCGVLCFFFHCRGGSRHVGREAPRREEDPPGGREERSSRRGGGARTAGSVPDSRERAPPEVRRGRQGALFFPGKPGFPPRRGAVKGLVTGPPQNRRRPGLDPARARWRFGSPPRVSDRWFLEAPPAPRTERRRQKTRPAARGAAAVGCAHPGRP